MKQIAIVENDFGGPEVEREAALAHGVELIYIPTESSSPLPQAALGADGILVRFRLVEEADMAQSQWTVIGRYGVGVDNIDVQAARDRGIEVINVPDYCVDEVASHTLMMALAAVRQLRQQMQFVSDGQWTQGATLAKVRAPQALTLGIVGLGRIGAEVARVSQGVFGRVLGFDPVKLDHDAPVEIRDSLTGLLQEADVVTLHVPLNSRTHHLIGAEALTHFKPGAILINVSRGGLVDQDAVLAAIEQGALWGAALDVTHPEPPADGSRILLDPKVLITPHVAWLSDDSTTRLRSMLADRCARKLTEETEHSGNEGRGNRG